MTRFGEMVQLRIELDGAKLHLGQSLSGIVRGPPATRVSLRPRLVARGVTESLQYEGSGRETVIGSDGSCRFSLPAPRWPPSFMGQHVLLGWEMATKAVEGPTTGGEATQDLELTLPPGAALLVDRVGPQGEKSAVDDVEPAPVRPTAPLLATILAVLALVALVLGLRAGIDPDPRGGGLGPMMLGVVGSLLLGGAAWWAARGPSADERALAALNDHARLRVGKPQLRVEPASQSVFRGGARELVVTLLVRPDAPPLQAEALLLIGESGQEIEASTSQRTTLPRYRHAAIVRETVGLKAAGPGRYLGRLQPPADAPGTFLSVAATIYWKIRVKLRCDELGFSDDVSCDLKARWSIEPDSGAGPLF